MITLLQLMAVLAASLFAGAALYINLAEHPARMKLDPPAAALQWAASYQRGTWLQAPLAVLSFACGTAVWLQGGPAGWLLAALLIAAVVPFTFLVIMPTNRALLSTRCEPAGPGTRRLLVRWARLHAVRTGLSLLAALVYLWLAIAAGRQPLG